MATAIAERAAFVRMNVAAINGVTVQDPDCVCSGIVTFTIDGADPQSVRASLAANSIIVSVSLAQHALLDMSKRHLDAAVRVSPHYFNSFEDLEQLVRAVTRLAR